MKTLENNLKEQKANIVNFLGQNLANNFNSEVTEYKKSHLLFIFNKRQVIVGVSVNDPPYMIREDAPIKFTPKSQSQDITKFDVKEQEFKNKQIENELLQREKEVDTLIAKMTIAQEENNQREKKIKEREEILENKERHIRKKEIELQSNEQIISNQSRELSQKNNEIILMNNSELETKEIELNNKISELEKKEVELTILKKKLKEKEKTLDEVEIELKTKEIKLNNNVNNALLKQNNLEEKEKELSKIKEILDETRENLTQREKNIEEKEKQIQSVDLSDSRYPLKSPTLSIENINGTMCLKWEVIDHADNYSIDYSFNSKLVDTADVHFDVKMLDNYILLNLEKFIVSGEYEFIITAIADEQNEFKNSLPSKSITHLVFNQNE